MGNPALKPYAPMTLADLSLALRTAGTEADRQLWVQEFLEEYRWEKPTTKAVLIRDRPEPTGDERYDALLAALAEHLSYHDHLAMPGWPQGSERFLKRWWFPVELPSVRADAIVHSPAAFRRRGIFIPEGYLSRA